MTTLRQRMLEDMQVRNLSPQTQRIYLEQITRFARHFHRSPAALGPEEIRAYQLHLRNDRHLRVTSIHVAVAALRFLYRVTLKKAWVIEDVIPAPRVPRRLPVVLSPDEVGRFLDGLPGLQYRALLATCYGAGLRVGEVVHLLPCEAEDGGSDGPLRHSPFDVDARRRRASVFRAILFPPGEPTRPLRRPVPTRRAACAPAKRSLTTCWSWRPRRATLRRSSASPPGGTRACSGTRAG
jgi:hypothetical protein